jgi:hypothetical protein
MVNGGKLMCLLLSPDIGERRNVIQRPVYIS